MSTEVPLPDYPNQSLNQPRNRGRLLGLCLVLLLLLALLAVPYALDAQRRRTAPPDIKDLARQIHFTYPAARDFYAALPQVISSEAILKECAELASGNEQLGGCLTSHGRIFIQRIDLPAVSKEMTVSAAHELLHVEYERLPGGERKRIDALLRAEIDKLKNPTLNQQINDGTHGETLNEAHSRLGTEYANLSPELEKYFSRYFKDRALIVKAQLAYLAVINQSQSAIDQERRKLDELRTQADAFRRRDEIADYNALVDPINELTAKYNEDVAAYNVLTAHTRRPGS